MCSRSAGSTRPSNALADGVVDGRSLDRAVGRTTPGLSRVPPMSTPTRYPSVAPDPYLATPTRPGSVSSRIAPSARSRSRSARNGTSRGSMPAAAASAAAVPAAWPIAMHCAIERTEAWASCVAEKQRPADQHVRGVAHQQRPDTGSRPPGPSGRYCQSVSAPAWWSSIGRAAQPDLLVELAGRRGRRRGSAGSRRTPGASRGRRSASPSAARRRVLVPGDAVDQEPDVLERLAPAGDLGLGQEPRVGGVDDPPSSATVRLEPGHDRRGHAVDRRDVVAALAARQVVAAATRPPRPSARSAAAFGQRPSPLEVDVGHPERRRQRLGRLELAGQLVAEAREVAQVGVARGVDEDRARDPLEARPSSPRRSRSTRPSRTSAAWTKAWSRTPAPGLARRAAPRRP